MCLLWWKWTFPLLFYLALRKNQTRACAWSFQSERHSGCSQTGSQKRFGLHHQWQLSHAQFWNAAESQIPTTWGKPHDTIFAEDFDQTVTKLAGFQAATAAFPMRDNLIVLDGCHKITVHTEDIWRTKRGKQQKCKPPHMYRTLYLFLLLHSGYRYSHWTANSFSVLQCIWWYQKQFPCSTPSCFLQRKTGSCFQRRKCYQHSSHWNPIWVVSLYHIVLKHQLFQCIHGTSTSSVTGTRMSSHSI